MLLKHSGTVKLAKPWQNNSWYSKCRLSLYFMLRSKQWIWALCCQCSNRTKPVLLHNSICCASSCCLTSSLVLVSPECKWVISSFRHTVELLRPSESYYKATKFSQLRVARIGLLLLYLTFWRETPFSLWQGSPSLSLKSLSLPFYRHAILLTAIICFEFGINLLLKPRIFFQDGQYPVRW